MTETELAWLSGWLEGEGTFVVTSGLGSNGRRYPRIRINGVSTDRDSLEHVQSIAGGRIYGPYARPEGVNGRPYYQWTLSTHKTALPLLRQLHMVSERRREQVQKAITAIENYLALPAGSKGA